LADRKAVVAIIGGSGLYDPLVFEERERRSLKTPYGPSPELVLGELGGREVVFLSRHGEGHALPPHRINYRANLFALKELGVERILATNSVGGISPHLLPGTILVPHDFLDLTRNREGTFYDREVVHIDVTEPYCPELRRVLREAGEEVLGGAVGGGIYGCTEGPRFETPAEIRMLKTLGCDVVGMTGLPEVVLARELEICYATLCTVANWAAGIQEEKLTATEVLEVVEKSRGRLGEILLRAVDLIPEERPCPCPNALEGARMGGERKTP
jgi:5'-methylthioadenosine phosphorylase